MAPPHDFKKAEKHLYQPKTDPVIIDVPEMLFIAEWTAWAIPHLLNTEGSAGFCTVTPTIKMGQSDDARGILRLRSPPLEGAVVEDAEALT